MFRFSQYKAACDDKAVLMLRNLKKFREEWRKEQETSNSKKSQLSKVMTIANKLVGEGYNRSNAMSKAWTMVRLAKLETKVAGVTYGNRQKAIEHLTRYDANRISVTLNRETENETDHNAIQVIAAVSGKGSYCMGYLPKALAAFVAPLMDAHKNVTAIYKGTKGTNEPYLNYGLAIEVQF